MISKSILNKIRYQFIKKMEKPVRPGPPLVDENIRKMMKT